MSPKTDPATARLASKRIAAIEQRMANATQGERWATSQIDEHYIVHEPMDDAPLAKFYQGPKEAQANAIQFACAPSDLTFCLTLIREQRERIAELDAEIAAMPHVRW